MADDIATSHRRVDEPQAGEPATHGSPEHLRALLSAAAGLRERNRALVRHMRGLIGEITEQQARLGRQAPYSDADVSEDDLRARFNLTDRELEVARLLAQGRRNTAIASALGISPHTARHHTQHVLAKLGVHSRAEAAARLRR